MSDQPETLILIYLRRIDEKLDRVIERIDQVDLRMERMRRPDIVGVAG